MSTKSQLIEDQSVQTPPERTVSLEDVVVAVRHDSQVDAKAYLEESKVPHGGE